MGRQLLSCGSMGACYFASHAEACRFKRNTVPVTGAKNNTITKQCFTAGRTRDEVVGHGIVLLGECSRALQKRSKDAMCIGKDHGACQLAMRGCCGA